jgi:eukaryotic-like serine/threonine-protein kinase
MAADTTPTTECPPTADLERLVRGRLTEARSAAIAEHVGACSACQQRLEALTGGGDHIAADLRECTKDTPPTDSAYYKALAAAEEELRATAIFLNGEGDRPDAEVKLEFLQPTDEPGRLGRLGSFQVIRVVGRGGMGVVLHAYDPCLARDVAIKVIDPKLANNEVARQRFCREARAAAAVTHDNLVAVHQVDEDEGSGLPYLVMQLIQGESLEQRLKRVGKLSVPEVARLGMQAAAGLAAAHAGGLIHRDIKPGNILLEAPVDRVKLTDFGLARAVEDVKLTRTGFVAGSPLYMAPEQARGDEIDHRADLFSLGSVLYEAATGTPAFDGKTPLAVLRRVADETPQPLHIVNSEVPVWLSDTIERLLAKDPADRFQTAAEVAEVFAAELARAHALSPLDVPAEVCAGSGSRSGTAARARKQICWKAVAFRVLPWLGGAIAGALLLWSLWSPGVVEREKLVEKEKLVEAPAPNPGPEPKAVLPGESGPVWALSFLAGDHLVVGMEDGSIKIWDLKKKTIFKTLEPRQDGVIWTTDVSADGKFLVTACDNSLVTLWNLNTFRREGLEFPHPSSARAAAFSPIGRFLAIGDRNSTVRVWDWENQVPVDLRGHRGTVHALAFSPDGNRLASAGSDGTAKVWNLKEINWDKREGPGRSMELAEHRGPVYGVAFSPDGTKLATAGWDKTVRIWDAVNGTQLQTIKAHDGDVWSVSFGGGGKWVASAGSDGFVRVWEVDTGKEVFAYRGGSAVHVVRFAHDGTTLAAGGRDGNVRVWELPK